MILVKCISSYKPEHLWSLFDNCLSNLKRYGPKLWDFGKTFVVKAESILKYVCLVGGISMNEEIQEKLISLKTAWVKVNEIVEARAKPKLAKPKLAQAVTGKCYVKSNFIKANYYTNIIILIF